MFIKEEKNLNYHFVIAILSIVFLISASQAFSHGGKHAPGKFTHLQALKKATSCSGVRGRIGLASSIGIRSIANPLKGLGAYAGR